MQVGVARVELRGPFEVAQRLPGVPECMQLDPDQVQRVHQVGLGAENFQAAPDAGLQIVFLVLGLGLAPRIGPQGSLSPPS